MSKRSATRENIALNDEAPLPQARAESVIAKNALGGLSLSDAFRSAAIGCAIIGLDGRWLEVNGRMTDLLGYSSAELLEMTFDQAVYSENLPEILNARNSLLSGQLEYFNLELRYRRKDASEVWCELHVALLRAVDDTDSHQMLLG